MSGRNSSRVAVVVAAIDSDVDVIRVLKRLVQEARGFGRVILIDGSYDRRALNAARTFPEIELSPGRAGALVPELWREGLMAASEELVAFTTTQTSPARGWLAALVHRLESSDAAAVGGPIEPARRLKAFDRAVYLLRYVRYILPLQEENLLEPPGDNALYRRERLSNLDSFVKDGFWESEINRELRARARVSSWKNKPSSRSSAARDRSSRASTAITTRGDMPPIVRPVSKWESGLSGRF